MCSHTTDMGTVQRRQFAAQLLWAAGKSQWGRAWPWTPPPSSSITPLGMLVCSHGARHNSSWSTAKEIVQQGGGTRIGDTGLFGLPSLRQPADFHRLAQDTRSRCEELVAAILTSEPSVRVVQLMDEMSDELCRCYDAAEACRNIHDDAAWRAAASDVCHDLGAYISTINHHQGMYSALVQALKQQAAEAASPPNASYDVSPGMRGGWCPESVRVAQQLVLDMEKAGIHLPSAQQARMQELMNQSHHYSAAFNRALRDHKQLGTVWVRGSQVRLDASSVGSVLANEQDEHVRQKVWLAASCSPSSNATLLASMLMARREQAALVGLPSYSSYKAQGASLAETPEAIVSFLLDLATSVRPAADQDIKVLQGLKARLTGCRPERVSVMPWDTDFLMGVARRTARGVPLPVLQEYTHLPVVLEGLGELMQRCLGITLKIQPAIAQESWAAGVLRCDASHPDLGPLGTVYLDLCSRPGKYPSAVTFPIRCGRQLPGGAYQSPIMALLADFGDMNCSPRDVRLNARELRVLLHEWGHCLHNLVSRTRYQHLSGTRCAQDLVEVPSHLAEHWVADVRSLQVLARHHSTREPLPEAACTAMFSQRSMFSGLELQQQLLLSLADQHLYSAAITTSHTDSLNSSDLWKEATQPVSSLPWIDGSQPELRLSHLTIYGATYYSYVFARCLSSAIWNKHLAADPLATGAGSHVVKNLLQPGGATHPAALVQELLGADALIRHPSGGWAPQQDALLLESTLTTFG